MNKIDNIKLKKNMTYEHIAKEAGLTPAYIYLLAKNKRKNPTLETMIKISEALGEKVEVVFKMN